MSKNYERIIDLIKISPMSQKQIQERIDISVQGVAKDLRRAIKEGHIAYLGNKVNKKDARAFLRDYFKLRDFPDRAHQCYIYTPKTEKFYKHLRVITKEKEEIKVILQLYRCLELSAMFQKLYYENLPILRRHFKSKGEDLSDKEIKEKIARKRKEVKGFYSSRNKGDSILRFLRLTPLMYWLAFRGGISLEPSQFAVGNNIPMYNPSLLIEKLKSLRTQKTINTS